MSIATHSSDGSPGGCLRVLVVEDETLLSLSLESMLEEWGHDQVGSAADGAAAVRLAREQGPDVVLMDINLAGSMDGIAAAAQIREFCEAPIVFMTAYSDTDLAAHPGLAGSEVLRKPFSPRRLQELLAAVAAAATQPPGPAPGRGSGAGQGR